MLRLLLLAVAVCGAFVSAAMAAGATYPERPVRCIVAYAAGGSADVLARLIAQKLSARWGQTIVVDNRPGASTTIGAGLVARATPDGYTLLFGTNAQTIPRDFRLDYDPVASFAPVILLASQPTLLVVNPALPVNSLRELIAYAKGRPGQLNFSSSGPGTMQWAEMVILMKMTGTSMVNVSYKGGNTNVLAVVTGEVQLAFASITAALELVKAGKLRALAVSSNVRMPVVQNVPTIAEAVEVPHDAGAGDRDWFGVSAPAGTPLAIVNQLNQDFAWALKLPEMQKVMTDQGYLTLLSTPDEFARKIKSDIAMWSAVLK